MAGLRDTIIGIKALGKDIKRDLMLEDERLFFLKASGESGRRFVLLLEPTSGWIAEWSDFRNQLRVKYSTIDPAFRDLMNICSYIGFGIPISGKVDLYSIDNDGRDVTPPTGSNSDWKIYASRVGTERYAVPV